MRRTVNRGRMSTKSFKRWCKHNRSHFDGTRKDLLEKMTKTHLVKILTEAGFKDFKSSAKKAELVELAFRHERIPEIPRGYTARHVFRALGIQLKRVTIHNGQGKSPSVRVMPQL